MVEMRSIGLLDDLSPAEQEARRGQIVPDFIDAARGVSYNAFDLLGAPVDVVNMGLQTVGLGSEKPFLGSESLMGMYGSVMPNFQEPTYSEAEMAGRLLGSVISPAAGYKGAKLLGEAIEQIPTRLEGSVEVDALLLGQGDKIAKTLPPAEASQKTQIATTGPTYAKAKQLLDESNPKGKTLDFGAGRGLGAKEIGADTYEPFPREGFNPNFTDPKSIPSESYEKLTSLNVLNVVPRAVRDEIVQDIGRVLKPEGEAIVTTRGRDVLDAKGDLADEPMSIVTSSGTYQKGFTQTELRDYVRETLGDGFEVESVKGLGKAGVKIKKKPVEQSSDVSRQSARLEAAVEGKPYVAKKGHSSKAPVKYTVGEAAFDKSGVSSITENYQEIAQGKALPITAVSGQFEGLNKSKVTRIANKIKNGEPVKPSTVVQNADGFQIVSNPEYIAALDKLGMGNFPAKIAVDMDNPPFPHLVSPSVNTTATAKQQRELAESAVAAGAAQAQGLKADASYFPKWKRKDIPLEETVVDTTPYQERPMDADEYDLQDHVGGLMKLMVGDRTMSGEYINAINDMILRNPVRMQGGFEYPLYNLGLGWASHPAVISGYANAARQAQREGRDLLGVYSAMGFPSGEFSHHVGDIAIDLVQNADIDPKMIAKFDEEMRKTKEDWVGIMSPDLDAYLYDPTRDMGAVRKAMVKKMDMAALRDAGFPDIPAIRYATNHPRFRLGSVDDAGYNAPTGARIVKFDEDPLVVRAGSNMNVNHKTYPSAIGGRNLGGYEYDIPRGILFPDFFEMRRMLGADPKYDRRAAETANIIQPITRKIADDASIYQENFRRGLLGF